MSRHKTHIAELAENIATSEAAIAEHRAELELIRRHLATLRSLGPAVDAIAFAIVHVARAETAEAERIGTLEARLERLKNERAGLAT